MSTEAPGDTTPTTTNVPTALKASDTTYLGTDQDGADHYHSRIHDHITVIKDDDVERRQDLNGRGLVTWIAYVDTQRGWARLNTADSFEDLLLEALEVDR